MFITTLVPHQLSVFKTIHQKEHPTHLDVLSHHGDLSLLDQLPDHGLAVVGTRYPQKRSIDFMAEVFHSLRGQNLIIVSGFARGIDTKAHEFALENGLKTIAILGCGIDIDYPRENQNLKEHILDHEGLIISEFHKNNEPYPGNFTRRNRLIAGFSKATWVVESAARSGSLNTANWAARMDREIFATPCFPGDIFYQGNETLLTHRDPEKFGFAHPFFGPESLNSVWPELSKRPAVAQQSFRFQSNVTRWVAELQSQFGSCHIQSLMNLAYQNGLSPGKFYLEFEKEISRGTITQDPDGKIQLIF